MLHVNVNAKCLMYLHVLKCTKCPSPAKSFSLLRDAGLFTFHLEQVATEKLKISSMYSIVCHRCFINIDKAVRDKKLELTLNLCPDN